MFRGDTQMETQLTSLMGGGQGWGHQTEVLGHQAHP